MKVTNKYLFYGAGAVVGVALIYMLHKSLQNKHNFDLAVFDSPDQKGSGKMMNSEFLVMLSKVEDIVGIKLQFNSGYRTDSHNKIVGGVFGSSHTKGLAVDIKAPTKAIRDKIVWAAKKVGFKRIGIGSNFVHLDCDSTKPQYVTWGYPAGSNPPYQVFA